MSYGTTAGCGQGAYLAAAGRAGDADAAGWIDYIALVREHYEKNGIGADYIGKLFR
jgi:hypothetical protein